MLRSLYSSISGLQNHQVRMDLIGNNIANVNTTGFKSQRVTFEESFAQLLEGSARPPGGGGGTNPIQVGLGMSVGSIDTLQTQGNIQSTGQVTDVAIEGDGYFAVSNGEGTFYSRNGAFQLDSKGQMVLPTNGYVLQGKMAADDGTFPAGTVVGDIVIPFDEQAPANATEKINFARNLNSDSEALGSVVYTQSFWHYAQPTDPITTMANSSGEQLNLKSQETLTFSGSVGGVYFESAPPLTLDETTTYQDVVNALDAWIGANLDPGVSASIVTAPAGDPNLGSIQIDSAAGAAIVKNLQVSSSGPISSAPVASAFSLPSTINPLDSFNTDAMRAPAESGDLLAEIWDSQGRVMGLENGDEVEVNANVGGDLLGGNTALLYNDATTTMQDVLDLVKDELKLQRTDGTPQDRLTVSMNAGNTDDNIPDGSLLVRGSAGTAFGISGLTIQASNSDADNIAPKFFNTNMSSTVYQQARDTGVYDTSITVYDESGGTHDLTMTFTHSGDPGVWNWDLSVAGNESILGGSQGVITFGLDGSVSSFSYDDNVSTVTIDPQNGSDIIQLQLDVGGPGNFEGITQFEAQTTVAAIKQDGYGTGSLNDISIDSSGFIKGVFSNGTNKNLGQMVVAQFTNPGGLQKVSDSVYIISSNSGDAVYTTADASGSVILRPGALELSNVELSREFTDMITTQRGYQANSRVITVSDSMLEELMSLKR